MKAVLWIVGVGLDHAEGALDRPRLLLNVTRASVTNIGSKAIQIGMMMAYEWAD